MVVPRFGAGIVGGAETLVRGLARRAGGEGCEIAVATTCATDHETWANALPAGEAVEDGVRVRRFPVGDRDPARHAGLHARLQREGSLPYLDELRLMGAGVWSPELQRFIEEEGPAHDLIVFAPYLFGTTYWGLQAWPERSAVMPCLHDEPDAHMRCLRRPFEAAAGFLFNSPGEERLARRLFRVRGGGVVGAGFDPPGPASSEAAIAAATAAHGLTPGRYVLYAGRLEDAKRVGVAVEYLASFAAAHAPDLRLALMGRGGYRVPRRYRERVVELGYVDAAAKRSFHAGALALVNPSELESLSLVLMESWLEGVPVLAAAGSEVMAEHCARSGGGFTFAGRDDFAASLARLLDEPALRAEMGAAGRRYVLAEYGWPAVRARFRAVTEALAAR